MYGTRIIFAILSSGSARSYGTTPANRAIFRLNPRWGIVSLTGDAIRLTSVAVPERVEPHLDARPGRLTWLQPDTSVAR
jgi:hypothetical protein